MNATLAYYLAVNSFTIGAIVLGVIVAVFGVVMIVRLLSRPPENDQPEADLSLDVSKLSDAGPADESPRLELLHVPMRLAAVVLSPAGRGELPANLNLSELLNHLVPGLGNVARRDQPVVRIWPGQISSHGFANSFFSQVQLPGARGKGTPWCSVAGRFEAADQKLLVGLVLRAATANSLSQLTVEQAAQWLDMLRIK